MGNLLTMLSIWRALRYRDKPILEFSSRKGWGLVVEVGKQAMAAMIALLLVAFCVAFFYLYCLPWLGVH
jgi:hypothetical protein